MKTQNRSKMVLPIELLSGSPENKNKAVSISNMAILPSEKPTAAYLVLLIPSDLC